MSYLGRSAKLSLKAQEKVSFLATAGQTVKTGLSYTPSFIEVYVNGVLLTDTTDFTATNGNSITFTVALLLNDEVTVISLKTFTVADHLPKSGGTMTGDTFHGDNVAARFGAGNDLSINHTGSYSSIVDSGTGDLWIAADANVNIANAALNEYKAQFISNGAVNLYHDNVAKFSTTSTGVAITGGGTMTGALFIASPNQATGGSALQIRQGNNTPYGIDMGISQTTGDLNISKVNNGTSTHMMTLGRYSGNVGINTASPTAKLHIVGANASAAVKIIGGATNGYYNLEIQNNTSNGYGVGFKDGGSIVGSIMTSGVGTAYNTSSDYRLKTDVQPMTGAADRVKLLKPCNFEWISDGTRVDGFLAHEAQEVVPEAVHGTKDAMRDEEYEVNPATGDMFTPSIDAYVDADENEVEAVAEVIHSTDVEQPETLQESQQWRETTAAVMGTRSVPDMQGIDQAKLVPLLTATIQELIARIEALEGAAP